MGKIVIQNETIKNPITFMGKQAGIAYHSNIEDEQKNYKRGLQCIKDGHYRMLEFCDIYFTMENYSNRVIREFFRHVGDGLTAIQESTRYVDFSKGFDYIIPPSIEKDEIGKQIYENTMKTITDAINHLMEKGVPKEDAQMLIPLGASTKVAIKKNMRNIVDMSRVRMCNRAYWEYRNIMTDLKRELSEYSEEWKTLCDMLLYAKCEPNKICLEKFSCGKYPQKEQ